MSGRVLLGQFLKLSWVDGKPRLGFWLQKEKRPANIPLVSGQELTLYFTGPRLCTGYWDQKTRGYVVCPRSEVLGAGSEYQCLDCRRHETSYYDFTGQARTHAPTAAVLGSTPHLVYLALYDAGTVKVGVTRESRGNARFLEQGASAALVVAATDGLSARDVEAKIASLTGIVDRVHVATRMKVLRNPPSEDEAVAVLDAAAVRVHSELPELIGDEQYRNHFHYLVPHYQLRENVDAGADATLVRSVDVDAVAAGEIVGVPGQLLLLRGPDGVVALDMGSLKGHVLKLASGPTQLAAGVPRLSGTKTLFN